MLIEFFIQTDDKKADIKPEKMESDKNSTEGKTANNNAPAKVEKSCK